VVLSDGTRRALHTRLIDVLGEEVADVLMDHLPPAGWSDLATKADLDAHAAATKKDLEVLELRMRAEMANGFAKMTRTFVVSQVALAIAMIGSLTGAVATLAH